MLGNTSRPDRPKATQGDLPKSGVDSAGSCVVDWVGVGREKVEGEKEMLTREQAIDTSIEIWKDLIASDTPSAGEKVRLTNLRGEFRNYCPLCEFDAENTREECSSCPYFTTFNVRCNSYGEPYSNWVQATPEGRYPDARKYAIEFLLKLMDIKRLDVIRLKTDATWTDVTQSCWVEAKRGTQPVARLRYYGKDEYELWAEPGYKLVFNTPRPNNYGFRIYKQD